MSQFKLVRKGDGQLSHIETSLMGYDLLNASKLNKGCAFTAIERELFHLTGLLPHQIETLEQQVARTYEQYQEHRTALSKHIHLNVLHDYNETLFYKLVSEHLEEMLPIIYTPTVGEAVERFSLEHRKSRGIYLSYPERNQMDMMLENRFPHEVDLIVVTDGEAVLGIGDQGIGGMNISVAKLMVYILCAGINPHRVLPIQLDTGTNNPELLKDPMYLGWQHERITGKEYDDFIEQFVSTIHKKFPHVFLHWEDVGRDNARRILNHYRDQLCTFNGDLQGTGVITLACILAGVIASEIPLKDHRIVVLGAGTAGVGISDQIVSALQREGLSESESRSRIWLIDKSGLLTEKSESVLNFQQPYLRKSHEVKNWNAFDLETVVENVKPTILIGCSTASNAFSEKIVKTMAKYTKRPIIMPLSNPTSKSEATPDNLMQWTNGHAIIATGSPFPDVLFHGKNFRIAQSNNAFAFPGIGLAAILCRPKCISDEMLWAATQTIARCSPIHQDSSAPLLPKLSDVRKISCEIAIAVTRVAQQQGLTQLHGEINFEEALKRIMWEPKYYPYKKL